MACSCSWCNALWLANCRVLFSRNEHGPITSLLASNVRSLWENLKPRPSRIDVAIARSRSPSEISPWRPDPRLVSSYSYLLVLFVPHKTPDMRIIRCDSMRQLSVPVFEKVCNLSVSFCCGGLLTIDYAITHTCPISTGVFKSLQKHWSKLPRTSQDKYLNDHIERLLVSGLKYSWHQQGTDYSLTFFKNEWELNQLEL